MTIEEMQNTIRAEGWQWLEHMYHPNDYRNNDGISDCYIRLSKSENPHAFEFGTENYDSKEIGWGRYSRLHCWSEAYQYIVVLKEVNTNG